MIRRADYWIGTRLFHPPIIWLCQRAGMTQHAVARYAWLAAALTFVARIGSGPYSTGLGFSIFATLIAITSTITTALYPDLPTRPSFLFRVVLWGLLASDILDLFHGHRSDREMEWEAVWGGLALIGEYAKTITTIPPRKRRERRVQAKEAYS